MQPGSWTSTVAARSTSALASLVWLTQVSLVWLWSGSGLAGSGPAGSGLALVWSAWSGSGLADSSAALVWLTHVLPWSPLLSCMHAGC